MQDMDNKIMEAENMENTMLEPWQTGETPLPENPDGINLAEEGGMQDASQQEEVQEKPKRRRKKGDEEQPQDIPNDEQPGSEETNENEDGMVGEEEAMDEPEDFSSENDDEVSASPSRRARGLDSQGRIIYDQGDRGQHDLSILTGARNARRILTTTVDGIDTDGSTQPRVVFYVGTVKVLIPFSEMGMDLNPKEIEPGEAARIIDYMLGAKIDYMVRGVDAKNRIAGASRRAAMLLRRETILNAWQGDGYRVNVGTVATARVLQVYRASMLVEVYGYQTYIRRNATSKLWVNDIRDFANVGDEKLVEVMELERDAAGVVTHLEVSIKGAEELTYTELRTGNTYTGKICSFSTTAYYVRVAGVPMDVRCPINSNQVIDMMEVGDYVKFVVRGVYDGTPTASIRKIIKKAIPTPW